jgi:hypothetical protein
LLAALPGGHQHKQGNTGDHRERTALLFGTLAAKYNRPPQETDQHRHRENRPFPQQQHRPDTRMVVISIVPVTATAYAEAKAPGIQSRVRAALADHQRPVHRADVDLPCSSLEVCWMYMRGM